MSKLITEFNQLKNDKERWVFVLAHKSNLRIELDNDCTMVIDDNANEDDEENYATFDSYVGWSDGVITLLGAIGLDADSC